MRSDLWRRTSFGLVSGVVRARTLTTFINDPNA